MNRRQFLAASAAATVAKALPSVGDCDRDRVYSVTDPETGLTLRMKSRRPGEVTTYRRWVTQQDDRVVGAIFGHCDRERIAADLAWRYGCPAPLWKWPT